MEKYYSLNDPSVLMHVVFRKADFTQQRRDIIDPHNFLQCSALKMEKGKTFRPHIHIWKKGQDVAIAQESWIVISGKVKCIFYDTDKQVLAMPILNPGDASFTLLGAHNYEIMEKDTIVYEMKTGPYEGVEKDKKFI